jgi:carboxyl-terminal processing protease
MVSLSADKTSMNTRTIHWAILILGIGMTACGGGGSGSGSGTPIQTQGGNSSGLTYTPGVFMPSSQFKGKCAAPRAGNAADAPGTALDENLWLRSWTNELYLWYSEVPDLDPAGFSTANYFNVLKTSAKTATGSPKDKFHFTYDTAEWQSFSQSGTQAGYGFDLELIASTPPRQGYVAFIEPGSPAATANIQRGTQFVTVDGADFANGSATTLNAALFPSKAGEAHSFVVRDPNGTTRTVPLTSANITETPVQFVKSISIGAERVGYLLFNDHIATAESQLISAINTLKSANVTDLVLDIRYNGGGYLDLASELAYMIGGSNTTGHFFEKTQFNDKSTTTDPVTKRALTPTPFWTQAQGFSAASGAPLPTLNLPKVYVLTGPNTCSASESIINGLRGANVTVVQIGSTTCGKPYGFYPQDNCGTTYFSIEFRGINDAGFGDYSDGFSPNNASSRTNAVLPGCSVADDFTHQLGDPLESRLAAALAYRTGGAASCPAATGVGPGRVVIQSVQGTTDESQALSAKSPLRENRWLRQ